MPTYPPRNNPTRKIEILDQKILDFLKCIRQNCSEEKLVEKTENVKTAKLNLIKARLNLLRGYREEDTTEYKTNLINKLKLEKLKWESFSFQDIKKEISD